MNSAVDETYLTVATSKIKAKKNQVRKVFNEESIFELGESILSEGLIQPIIVSPEGDDGLMEIQKGERRWRAHLAVDLPTIQVIVRPPKVSSVDALVGELIENIQREDLSIMEIAQAISSFKDENDKIWTHEKIAKKLGKSRSWITKISTMTSLAPCIMELYEKGLTKDVSILYNLRSLYSKNPELCEELCTAALLSSSITRKQVDDALSITKSGPIPGDDESDYQLSTGGEDEPEENYEMFGGGGENSSSEDANAYGGYGSDDNKDEYEKEDSNAVPPSMYEPKKFVSEPEENIKSGPINFASTHSNTEVYEDDDEPVIISRVFKTSPDYEGEAESKEFDKANKEKTFKFIKAEEAIIGVEINIDGVVSKGVLDLNRQDAVGVFWVKITKGKSFDVVRATANQLVLVDLTS